MSKYAITPETYAAWQEVEADEGDNLYEQDWAEFARGEEELALRTAGTRYPLPRSRGLGC
jgi:hypothetical protein